MAFPIDATLASKSKQYNEMTENFLTQKRGWEFGSFKFYTEPLQLIFASYIMAKSGWHKSGDWSLDRLSFDGATVIVVFRIGYQSKKLVAQKRGCPYVAFPIDACLP